MRKLRGKIAREMVSIRLARSINRRRIWNSEWPGGSEANKAAASERGPSPDRWTSKPKLDKKKSWLCWANSCEEQETDKGDPEVDNDWSVWIFRSLIYISTYTAGIELPFYYDRFQKHLYRPLDIKQQYHIKCMQCVCVPVYRHCSDLCSCKRLCCL